MLIHRMSGENKTVVISRLTALTLVDIGFGD